jgi:protein-arginine kinase activator protein McsA
MAAHQDDTKEFGELTFAEQARSVSAMLNNIQAAIKHHVRHSPHRQETADKCVAQVERLLERLRSELRAEAEPGAAADGGA